MKKATLTFGYISGLLFLLGSILKIQHWPYSGIAFVLGSFLFAFVYAPLLFLLKRKTANSLFSKFFNVVILLLMLLLPIGFTFKIMHWPDAFVLVTLSNISLFLLIILMIIYAIKEKEETKKIGLHNQAVILFFLTAFSLYVFLGASNKYILNQFVPIDNNIKTEIQFYNDKTNDLYATFENSQKATGAGKKYFEMATEVKAKSDSLVSYILSLRNEIVRIVEKNDKPDTLTLENIMNKDNSDVATFILVGEKPDGSAGKARDYRNKLDVYKEFAEKNTNNRGKEILKIFFDTSDPIGDMDKPENKYWETKKYYNITLASVIIDFNMDIMHIRMLEAETMEYLQFMGSRETPIVKKEEK